MSIARSTSFGIASSVARGLGGGSRPTLAQANSSAIHDWDVTQPASYPGSGSEITCLISGEKLNIESGFTYSGSGESAKLETDGTGRLQAANLVVSNTVRDVAKTTGGSAATFYFAFRSPDTIALRTLFGNTNFNASGFQVRALGTGQLQFNQTNELGAATLNSVGGVISTDTNYLLAVAVDSTNGILKSSLNASTLTDHAYTPNVTTTNPNQFLRVFGNVAESQLVGTGAEFFSLGVIGKIVSDAEHQAIVAVYERAWP